MSRPPVIVVGLDCPTGLQTARVFAKRGIEVIGVAQNVRHPCARTRVCQRVVQEGPGTSGVVEALLRIGAELEGRAVVIPCTDLAVLAISRARERLPDRLLVALPQPEVIETLIDKARFAEFAGRHELPVPATRVVRSADDLNRAACEIGFPCVLKPAVKTVEWDRHVQAKAFVVDTREALFEKYRSYARWADSLVLQEWVAGEDGDHYTCDCYISRSGAPLVSFTSRKIRHWPPEAGQASLSVECQNDVVRREALRTFAAAAYSGQGYVEMKRDSRTGRHVILEANVGRPTGRSATAERAGVELLMTVYSDLVGDPLPEARVQRYRGVKWIHIRRDLQACVYLLYHRRTTIREILRSWTGPFAFALFSLRDPLPFLADFSAAGRSLLPSFGRPRRRHVLSGMRAMKAQAAVASPEPSSARRPLPPEPPRPPHRGADPRHSNPLISVALAAAGLAVLRAAPALISLLPVE